MKARLLARLALSSSILVLPVASLAEPRWLPPPALLWPADGDEAVRGAPLFVRSVDVVELDGPAGRFQVPFETTGDGGSLYVPEEPLALGTWTVHGLPAPSLENQEDLGMVELGSFTVVEGTPPTEPPVAIALRGRWRMDDGSIEVEVDEEAAGALRRYELDLGDASHPLDGSPDGESHWTVSQTVSLSRFAGSAFDVDSGLARVRPIDAFGLAGEWSEAVAIAVTASERGSGCQAAPGIGGGGPSALAAGLALVLARTRRLRRP